MSFGRVMGATALAMFTVAGSAAEKSGRPGDSSRMVCTYESSTGSHLKKRVCATEQQRGARAEQDRKGLADVKPRARPEAGSRQ